MRRGLRFVAAASVLVAVESRRPSRRLPRPLAELVDVLHELLWCELVAYVADVAV